MVESMSVASGALACDSHGYCTHANDEAISVNDNSSPLQCRIQNAAYKRISQDGKSHPQLNTKSVIYEPRVEKADRIMSTPIRCRQPVRQVSVDACHRKPAAASESTYPSVRYLRSASALTLSPQLSNRNLALPF